MSRNFFSLFFFFFIPLYHIGKEQILRSRIWRSITSLYLKRFDAVCWIQKKANRSPFLFLLLWIVLVEILWSKPYSSTTTRLSGQRTCSCIMYKNRMSKWQVNTIHFQRSEVTFSKLNYDWKWKGDTHKKMENRTRNRKTTTIIFFCKRDETRYRIYIFLW